jgi:hypothetical protein
MLELHKKIPWDRTFCIFCSSPLSLPSCRQNPTSFHFNFPIIFTLYDILNKKFSIRKHKYGLMDERFKFALIQVILVM